MARTFDNASTSRGFAFGYVTPETASAIGGYYLTSGYAMGGVMDGSNKIFTLGATPDTNLSPVYILVGGLWLQENSNGYNFVRSALTCTLGANVLAPGSDDPKPRAFYIAS